MVNLTSKSSLYQVIENACLDLLISKKKIDALVFATNLLSIEGLYYMHKKKINQN